MNERPELRIQDPEMTGGAAHPAPLPRLLKPGAVAEMLGVSRSWVYAAAADGRIPSLRLGGPDGPLRFVAEDVEEWLTAARAAWRPGQTTTETLRRAQGGG
ncbi:MAG: helix-turn-helix domain-containing protein [Thermoleophilia bacterium]